jgi:hypothetical protein
MYTLFFARFRPLKRFGYSKCVWWDRRDLVIADIAVIGNQKKSL